MRRQVRPEELTDNVFRLIGSDWMLITAGTLEAHNMMTASWGGMGVIWGKSVCWCAVRPQRHTRGFMDREESFTLCFFEERYRPALDLCGTKSGRDMDKAKAAGLTPEAGPLPRTTQFAEARLVIACRKIYTHDLDPARFLDPKIEQNYPAKDYHRIYVGEIISIGQSEPGIGS